jgi:N-dimethylarginine dimethylaminohydrolase
MSITEYGVTSEYGRIRKLLVCRPFYFQWEPVNETAKKYLELGHSFTRAEALAQHKELRQAFESKQVEVIEVPPVEGYNYQVYTRDFGKCTPQGIILGNFRYPLRKSETDHMQGFFDKLGIPLLGRVKDGILEGGDIHYIDEETVAVGVGGRSDKAGCQEAVAWFKHAGFQLITVPFAAEYCHLDILYVRLNAHTCVANPAGLPDSFLRLLKDKHIDIIEVPDDESRDLMCNVVSIDGETIVSPAENINTNRKLKAAGFEVLEPHYDIFLRGGGGPRCSTFILKRDPV